MIFSSPLHIPGFFDTSVIDATFFDRLSHVYPPQYGGVGGPASLMASDAFTNTQPVDEHPQNLPGFCFNSFKDDLYERIHINPSFMNLGNLFESISRDVSIWNAYTTPQELQIINSTGAVGILLVEPDPAPTTFSPLEERIYQIQVEASGPPELNAFYDFVFTTANDVSLNVVGTRVVVWNFIPQRGATEAFEWRTDIIQTKTREQRLALRTVPRQYLQYDFQYTQQQFSEVKALVEEWYFRTFSIPNWGEGAEVGSVSSGTTTLNVDTTTANFRVGGTALLVETFDNLETVTILSLTPTSITLDLPVANDYALALLCPMVVGRLEGPPQFQRTNFNIITGSANFYLTELNDFGATDLPIYLGAEVLIDRSINSGNLNESIMRNVEYIDNELSPIYVDQIQEYTVHMETINWKNVSRSDTWRVKQWIQTRFGKQKAFWLPSWNRDLIIVDDVASASTSIVVEYIGYTLYYTLTSILILLKDGTVIYKDVDGSAINMLNQEVLSLTTPMGVDFLATDVDICCFMNYTRFDSDRIEINHQHGGSSQITVPTKRVNRSELS